MFYYILEQFSVLYNIFLKLKNFEHYLENQGRRRGG